MKKFRRFALERFFDLIVILCCTQFALANSTSNLPGNSATQSLKDVVKKLQSNDQRISVLAKTVDGVDSYVILHANSRQRIPSRKKTILGSIVATAVFMAASYGWNRSSNTRTLDNTPPLPAQKKSQAVPAASGAVVDPSIDEGGPVGVYSLQGSAFNVDEDDTGMRLISQRERIIDLSAADPDARHPLGEGARIRSIAAPDGTSIKKRFKGGLSAAKMHGANAATTLIMIYTGTHIFKAIIKPFVGKNAYFRWTNHYTSFSGDSSVKLARAIDQKLSQTIAKVAARVSREGKDGGEPAKNLTSENDSEATNEAVNDVVSVAKGENFAEADTVVAVKILQLEPIDLEKMEPVESLLTHRSFGYRLVPLDENADH